MKTAVEWLESEMLEHYSPFDNKLLYSMQKNGLAVPSKKVKNNKIRKKLVQKYYKK